MNTLELLAEILIPIFLGDTTYVCGDCGATYPSEPGLLGHRGTCHGS